MTQMTQMNTAVSFTCHVHPCNTAKERELAMRIAQKVQKTHASDREDLVEDLRFTLSAEGLEEARLKRVEDHTEVIIEGRVLLTWLPVVAQVRSGSGSGQECQLPTDTADCPLTVQAAAIAYRYSPKTLRIYQAKGWLPAVLTDAAMRTFQSTLCKGRRAHSFTLAQYSLRGRGCSTLRRKRSLLERWRKNRARKDRRSCMRSRGCETQPWRSVIPYGHSQQTPFRAITDCFGRDGLAMTEGSLLALQHPREYYLRDVTAELALRAVGEVMLGSGPPGAMALAHAPK